MSNDSAPRSGAGQFSVGRYEVIAHIASGGMGAVYKARDPMLGRIVALKILSPEMAAKAAMRNRFFREARVAAKLRHENIVQIYDFGEVQGTYFLALEFVDGIDLLRYLERQPGGKMPIDQAKDILRQAARALDQTFAQGIVHRDIKPANFLVTTRAGKLVVKLADLGLAREENSDDARITRDNTTLGTVDYISPEQTRDAAAADIRSDLYSLGCSAFHLLTGQTPFPTGTLVQRLQAHLNTPPPNIRVLRPEVPEALAAIIHRLLAKDPEDRFPSPLHLLRELETAESFQRYLEETQDLERPIRLPEQEPDILSAGSFAVDASPPVSTSPTSTSSKDTDHKDTSPEILSPRPGQASAPAPSAAPDTDVVRVSPVARATSEPTSGEPTHTAPAARKPGGPKATARSRSARTEGARSDPEAVPAKMAPTSRKRERSRERSRSRPLWRRPWFLGVVLGGSVLVAGAVVLVMSLLPQPQEKKPVAKAPGPVVAVPIPPMPPPMEMPPDMEPLVLVGPDRPELAVLAKNLMKLEGSDVEREILGPHVLPPEPPREARVLRIRRGNAAGPDFFPSLAQAWKAAAEQGDTVLEIHDQGPLPVPTLPPLARGNIWLRPAPGYRPLLFWDRDPDEAAPAWFTVTHGNVVIRDLDLNVRSAGAGTEGIACFLLQDGHFHARECTFTQTGPGNQPSAVVRLRTRGSVRENAEPVRARLSRCLLRGSALTAAALDAPAADLLLDATLAVGQFPLIQVVGTDPDAVAIRWLRSTLLGDAALVEHVANGIGQTPRLSFFAADSILSRRGALDPDPGLIRLDPKVSTVGLSGRFLNVVYAGWKTLVRTDRARVASSQEWRDYWGHFGGDLVVPEAWPTAADNAPLDTFAALDASPQGGPLAFVALTGPGAIGCDVGRLPPEPLPWRVRSPEMLPRATLEPPDALAPTIETGTDGLYRGEVLDLTTIPDLGAHLAGLQMAPRVVLHLTGKGVFVSSPIRFRGERLSLFCPPRDGPTLEFKMGPAAAAAAIDVEQGDLELLNTRLRLDWFKHGEPPPSLLRVRGGQLALARCVLQTPLAKVPESFRTLLDVGDPAGGQFRLACRDSVLQSGAAITHIEGASQVHCLNSFLFARDDALVVRPAADPGPIPSIVQFDHDTLALEKAFLAIAGKEPRPRLAPLFVHALSNHFTSPTPGREAHLLRVEGDELARGAIAWRGQSNVVDKMGVSRFVVLGAEPGPTQSPETWLELWGKAGERDLLVRESKPPTKAFDGNRPQFDRFILPSTLRLDLPGAKMAELLPLVQLPKKKK